MTILLSLSVFSLMIADALPQTSEAIPLLGQQPSYNGFECTLFHSVLLVTELESMCVDLKGILNDSSFTLFSCYQSIIFHELEIVEHF